MKRQLLRFAGSEFVAYVAMTREENARGVSILDNLGEREAMFFYLPPGRRIFNMRDVKFPLDVVFLDKDKNIVGYGTNILPSPSSEFDIPDNAMYMIEFKSGTLDKILHYI